MRGDRRSISDDRIAARARNSIFHENNPSYFGRPQGVVAEAEALQETVDSLKRVVCALAADPALDRLEARRLLGDFCATLALYFEAGEARRYFRAVLVERPDLEDGVDALLNGRRLLRDSVTYIRRMAFCRPDAGDLGRGISDVLTQFERHEHAENDLVQRFFRNAGALAPAAP